MRLWYSLADDGETPVPHGDYMSMARAARARNITDINAEYGRVGDWNGVDENGQTIRVSTVFLSLDHAHLGGPPILWETMLFGCPEDSKLDQWQNRYTSAQAAKRGHHWYVWLAQRLGFAGAEKTR